MSQEDLTQFLQAVQQDPSLQEKLKTEGADPVAIAKETGFSITKGELIRAHAAHVQTLSDEDLENVAGGTVGIGMVGIVAVNGIVVLTAGVTQRDHQGKDTA